MLISAGMIEEAAEKMETDDLTAPISNKKYYIDTNNIRVAREKMEMKAFMKDCMSTYQYVSGKYADSMMCVSYQA